MNAIRILTVAGLLLLLCACAPLRAQGPTAAPEPAQPATGPAQGLLTGPVISSTGVRLELPRLTHGADCIRLNVALSGIYPPSGAGPDYRPPMPIVDAAILYGGSDIALEPHGGGGGGGQGEDGAFGIGQEMVYEIGTQLPADVPLPMILDLTLDDTLGFEAPLRFAIQGEVDPAPNCGLQGSSAP